MMTLNILQGTFFATKLSIKWLLATGLTRTSSGQFESRKKCLIRSQVCVNRDDMSFRQRSAQLAARSSFYFNPHSSVR